MLLVLCCCGCALACRARVGAERAPQERPLVVLVLGDLRGMLEPCGCTSHPKGGLYRMGTVAARLRQTASALTLVSGGDLLFDTARPLAERSGQELAKAETLTEGLRRLGLWASARGELDRAGEGPPAPCPWASLEPGQRVVADHGAVRLGAVAASPQDLVAAQAGVNDARAEGAQVVFLLVRGDREATRRVARAVRGADFAVVGQGGEASAAAERVGATVLLEVGGQGEHLGALELWLPQPGAPIADGEPGRDVLRVAGLRVAQLRRRLALARKEGDGRAAAFFEGALGQALADELRAGERLAAERPRGRNHFRFRLVTLDRAVPEEPALLALRHAYKGRLRELSLRDAARFRAPPALAGAATYVGSEGCAACHPQAFAFWRSTPHGRAFATLEKDKSDYDLACVSCHVTGYLRPGGASLTERPELRDVGCEACHGPGSAHAAAPVERKRSLIRRAVGPETCLSCHTREHSDLFDFGRYRPRVLGPGHGLSAAGPISPSGAAVVGP